MTLIVNGTNISDEAVYREMRYHPAPSADKAQQAASRALVIRELLLQEAKQQAPQALSTETEEAIIDNLIKQNITTPQADTASCKRYYQQNLKRFTNATTGIPIPFEYAEPKIRDYLQTRSLYTGVAEYIRLLIGRAKIEGVEFE